MEFLGRHTPIEALVKGAPRRIDREEFVILFEQLDVIDSQSLNLVNVLDSLVGAVARNFPRGMWIHARKIFVFVLCVCVCVRERRIVDVRFAFFLPDRNDGTAARVFVNKCSPQTRC